MKKLFMLAIVCILLSSVLFSTDYPLGTFSFMGNKEWAYFHRNAFNTYMQQLGYNTSLIELFPTTYPNIDGPVSSDLAGVFSSMRDHGLKAAIMDKMYSPSEIGSSYAYTTGSYMKFEAEFSDWTAVDPEDRYRSDYWYGSREARYMNEQQAVVDTVRVGEAAQDNVYPTSYGYVWQCTAGQDQAGFAYGDLRYRWKGRPSTVGGDSLDIRVGKEFVLKKIDPGRSIPGDFIDRLYIRYAFKLYYDPDSLDVSDKVLSFSIVGYPYDGGGHTANPDSLQLIIGGSIIGNEYNLTRSAYESLPTHPNYTDYRYLDIEVTYAELLSKNLLEDNSAWNYRLVNINPRVYWPGNCDLSLDFIEIKDQLYKNIESNPGVYEAAVASRLSTLQSTSQGAISHVFSFDEPYPPQFRSYQKLETSPQLSGRPEKQFTAVNVRGFRQFPIGIDPSIPNETKYYNNVEAFINVTNPRYLMVNPYPITPEVLWNESTYDENHIQNILDDFVLDKYRDAKEHSDLVEGGEFYACVQAMGRWRDNNWKEYILPPPQTQEMMQYLPLCYGADGIFNYRLFGNVDHPNLTSDEYGALVSVNLGSPIVNPPTFNAIQTANGKIKKYGPIITNLEWKGSNTILQSSTNPYVETSSLYITGIANANSTLSGPYGCYVQAGYFKDSFNNPSIMLVNRRANYFNANGLGNPKDVSISNYYACYPAFNSQKITVSISESATAQFGDYVALYDVASDSLYFEEGLDRTIQLEPGEGKYLQMCGTLPSLVSESISMPQKSVIGGEVTLSPSTVVSFLSNSSITVLPNTHITLSRGSILNLAGSITIGDSVRFSIADHAIVNISEANCEFIGALFIEGNGLFNVSDSTNSMYSSYKEYSGSTIYPISYIRNNATVNLSGNINYTNLSQVIVTGQSELSYLNAVLTLGVAAKIKADNSCLNFFHTSISPSSVAGDSIIVNNLSSINIQNSTIRNAPIYVRGSDLLMENSYIQVKSGKSGIMVTNPYTDRSVRLTGNLGRNGFTGHRISKTLRSWIPVAVPDTFWLPPCACLFPC